MAALREVEGLASGTGLHELDPKMGRKQGIEAHSAEDYFPFFLLFIILLFLSKFKNFNSKRNSFCGKFVLGLDIKFELANMIFLISFILYFIVFLSYSIYSK
jgi:hypothetical protein